MAAKSTTASRSATQTQRRGAGRRDNGDSLTSVGLSYAGGAGAAIASSYIAEKTGLSKSTVALTEAGVGAFMALKVENPTLKRVGAGMGVAGAVLFALDWKQEQDAKKRELARGERPQPLAGGGERRQASGDYVLRDDLQRAVREEVQQAMGDNNRELVNLMRSEFRNALGDGDGNRDAAAADDHWRDDSGENRDAGGGDDHWRDDSGGDSRDAGGDDWRDAA